MIRDREQFLRQIEPHVLLPVAVAPIPVGAFAGCCSSSTSSDSCRTRPLQVGIGLLFGVLLWMVNFSPRIVWLRNRLRGEADVLLQLMPARLVPSPCAGDRSTLGIPQPFGRIVPDRAAAESA
jgi:hypothetical protein